MEKVTLVVGAVLIALDLVSLPLRLFSLRGDLLESGLVNLQTSGDEAGLGDRFFG